MNAGRFPVKRTVFLALIIGVVIGTVVAYFMFPRVITQEHETIKEKEKVVIDTVVVEKVKIVYRTKYIQVPKTDSAVSDSSANIADSLAGTMVPDDSLLAENTEADTTAVVEEPAIGTQTVISGDDIVVAQNELLETRYIIPEGNAGSFYCNANSNLDSLLVDNYTAKAEQEGIKVEFWRSPLNSVGYQLDKKKLVLFGFYEFDRIGLKYLEDGSIEMTYLDNVYRLECGHEFRALMIKK